MHCEHPRTQSTAVVEDGVVVKVIVKCLDCPMEWIN